MGVLGLWQLLAPVGQPVTLESLENKIFAVDISIWLNQALKGYRDSQGGSVPNAHLLSLFSRLCKLLFYKIRPVIVFDGGFPELKRQTIINRQQRRAAVKQSSKDIGLKILTNYLASQNLAKADGETSVTRIKPKAKVRDELFILPPPPNNLQDDTFESSEDTTEMKFSDFSKQDIKYLNTIDIDSDDFNCLPPDVKQEILSTLKESRRHRTWEQSQELPEDSNEFSSYQMQCLLKKRNLQRKLEQVQKDLRQINSADFVSQYTNDHVIGETNKIMSDDCSHYVLLKKIIQKSPDSLDKDDEGVSGTPSMMDTKNAFIKDMENIEVVDKIIDDKFGRKSTNVNHTVKKEVTMNNYADDEDVDNPPEIIQSKNFQKQSSEEKDVTESMLTNVDIASFSSSDDEDNTLSNQMNSKQIRNKVPDLDFSFQETESEKKCLLNLADSSIQVSVETERPVSKDGTVLVSSSDDEMVSCDEMSSEDYSTLTLQNSSSLLSKTILSPEGAKNTVSDIDFREVFKPIVNVDSCEQNENVVYSESPSKSTELNSLMLKSSSDVELTKGDAADSLPSTSFDQSSSTQRNPEIVHRNLQLQNDIDTATMLLEADQAKQDRQNRSVQDSMIDECKELLQLFGIPFVVSPTEAEAQCAFYDSANLTHGTITDDSDVWLFGGKRVYKNFFTQQKYVEFYKDSEIFTNYGLNQKKLINFAMLTGSDYTEGIEGVGPVTAMEIISEFPGESIDALQNFKEWWKNCNKHARPPENKVRAKLLKLVLGEQFPDDKILDAYLNPVIDESTEKFTWGRPDLDALRDYTRERFGWNKNKVDDALLPVIKKLGERDTQTHLDSFFTVTLKKQTDLFPSKRIMSALKKISSPQKGSSSGETEVKATKRRAITARKAVPRKVSVVTNTKLCKPQVPVLSEESSDEA